MSRKSKGDVVSRRIERASSRLLASYNLTAHDSRDVTILIDAVDELIAERDAALSILQKVRNYVHFRSSGDAREVGLILDDDD